jgi:hypothetical protein
LIINSSTIYNNIADQGGGIDNRSTLIINNSTLSGNVGGSEGGGIYNINQGHEDTTTIINSTIISNSADTGGGLFNFMGILTITNSIITGSPSGGNCAGEINDGGHNIDDGDTCGFSAGSFTEPQLGSLQDNGGPTLTHAPKVCSPAKDAIPLDACFVTEDQRGVTRPQGFGCDIGAVELIPGGYPIPTTTTINADEPDPSLVNQPFTVAFSVTSNIEVPTGIVSVTVNNLQENCTDILTNGSGSCQLSIDDPGIHTLNANYSGNTTYCPSSDSEVHIVSSTEVKLFLPLVLDNDQP